MNGELATTSSDHLKTQELKEIKVVEDTSVQKKKKKKRRNKAKKANSLPDIEQLNISGENGPPCVVNGSESLNGPKGNGKENIVVTKVCEVTESCKVAEEALNDTTVPEVFKVAENTIIDMPIKEVRKVAENIVNGALEVKEENCVDNTQLGKTVEESDAAKTDITRIEKKQGAVLANFIWAEDVEHDEANTLTTERALATDDVDITNITENGKTSVVSKSNEEEGSTSNGINRKLQWNVEAEPWLPKTESEPVERTEEQNKATDIQTSSAPKPSTSEGTQRAPVMLNRSSPRQRGGTRFRPGFEQRTPMIPPFPFGDGRFIGGYPMNEIHPSRYISRPNIRGGPSILPTYGNMLPQDWQRQARPMRGMETVNKPVRPHNGRGGRHGTPSPQRYPGRSPESFRPVAPSRGTTRRYSTSRPSAESYAIQPQPSNNTPLPTSAYVGQNLHFSYPYDPPTSPTQSVVHSQHPYYAYAGHQQPIQMGYEGHSQPPPAEHVEQQPRARVDYGGYPHPPYMEYGGQTMPMMLGAVQPPVVYMAPNESVGQLSPAPVECPVVYVCPNTMAFHTPPAVQPDADQQQVQVHGYPPGYDRMIYLSTAPGLFLQVNH